MQQLLCSKCSSEVILVLILVLVVVMVSVLLIVIDIGIMIIYKMFFLNFDNQVTKYKFYDCNRKTKDIKIDRQRDSLTRRI